MLDRVSLLEDEVVALTNKDSSLDTDIADLQRQITSNDGEISTNAGPSRVKAWGYDERL